MARSQIQNATAVAGAGKGKSTGIDGLLARKRFREGSVSPPRPQKKAALHHTSQGLLSGRERSKPFASTCAGQSSNTAVHGAILSPPYQSYDLQPTSHETSCFVHTSVPTPDGANAVAALGTPPSEETALHESYQPIIQYDTGSLPVIDGPVPSDTSILAPSLWPTALDPLPFSYWDDFQSQDPNVEAVSSYTADLIALGHSSSPPTTSTGLISDTTFSGYQNFPATPLSEHQFQLYAAQPAVGYDVAGQNGFGATPDVPVTGLNFELPLYQSSLFRNQAAASLAQTYQGPIFDQELPFLLMQGGYTEAPTKQNSPGSASSDEEAVVRKTSQSPESKAFLDDVPFKKEQRSPPHKTKEQSSLSPEPVPSIHCFHAKAQDVPDKEATKSPQKNSKLKTKLDPTIELQLVHQCFNSHGRSFASVPEPNDNWAAPANSVNSIQGQKARKPLGEDERQETSRTRDVGACVRCKIQRVRVGRQLSINNPLHVLNGGQNADLGCPYHSANRTRTSPTALAWRASKWPAIDPRSESTTLVVTGTSCRRSRCSELPGCGSPSGGRVRRSGTCPRSGSP